MKQLIQEMELREVIVFYLKDKKNGDIVRCMNSILVKSFDRYINGLYPNGDQTRLDFISRMDETCSFPDEDRQKMTKEITIDMMAEVMSIEFDALSEETIKKILSEDYIKEVDELISDLQSIAIASCIGINNPFVN